MNGAVARSMREKGSSYRVNFGLTMPLLQQIAARIQPDAAIAEELWKDTGVRESMLLAPMVYPATSFTAETARRWIQEIPNAEVADFCCKFLFLRLSYAPALIEEWVASPTPIIAYTAYRLAYGLFGPQINTEQTRTIARNAIPVALAGKSIAAIGARQWLFEALQHEEEGRLILSLLDEHPHIDPAWADNLRSLYHDNP